MVKLHGRSGKTKQYMRWFYEKKKKVVEYANFNCVFGDKKEPLLSNLRELFLPALKSSENIFKTEDLSYKVDSVKILKYDHYGYCITGRFIKNTYLEVLSRQDEKNEIILTNETYQTSPYSLFLIFVQNHKMFFVKNQKGSPTLFSFAKIIKEMIIMYAEKNNILNTNNNDFSVDVDIMPLPAKKHLMSN